MDNVFDKKATIKRNQRAIDESNINVLSFVLIGNLIIFTINLLMTFISAEMGEFGYFELRSSYALFMLIAGMFYMIIKLGDYGNANIFIYFVYVSGLCYCIITSAFISPNYLSVTILGILFQIPVLFVDQTWRITLFEILVVITYLCSIFFYKDKSLFVDELVNAISFAIIGLVVGYFTRKTKIHNFYMKEKLKEEAYLDQLTKLYNRRKLYNDLEGDVLITGLAILDIDYFKRYNDTYGHPAGDRCLCAVADILLSFKQAGNRVYRYGGEEFLVLFEDNSSEYILELLEKIRVEVERESEVTISLGVTLSSNENLQSYEFMLHEADEALYIAKNAGRNQIALYNRDKR